MPDSQDDFSNLGPMKIGHADGVIVLAIFKRQPITGISHA